MANETSGLIEWAKQRGWDHYLTRGGHLCFTKGPHKVFTGSTPRGGRRAIENAKATLRRYDRMLEAS